MWYIAVELIITGLVKMKKAIIFTSIPFILIGCGTGDGSSESTFPNTRELNVSFYALGVHQDVQKTINNDGEVVGILSDDINYTHQIEMCDYSLTVNDLNDEVIYDNICLYDNKSIIVSGEATVSLSHRRDGEYYYQDISQSYTVKGSSTVPASETSITINLTNDEWAYVTVDTDYRIESSVLSDANRDSYMSMSKDQYDLYYYGYTRTDSELSIELFNDDVLFTEISPEANQHYAYFLKEDPDSREGSIGFVIEDKWEEPLPIEIIKPAEKDVFIEESWITSSNINYTLTDYSFKGDDSYYDSLYMDVPISNSGLTIGELNWNKVKSQNYMSISASREQHYHMSVSFSNYKFNSAQIDNWYTGEMYHFDNYEDFINAAGLYQVPTYLNVSIDNMSGPFNVQVFDLLPRTEL
ncbi:hypothetical protein [Vibrio owensii]|uniref:hypothetical protein n=1 Tax=Vibrio owensii TaxID=696485 RepID=UPI0022DE3D6C|nr:hypothetical protein [Vibrio owensii]MDA0383604.1 hypothetical protein [Vibrio owensii]